MSHCPSEICALHISRTNDVFLQAIPSRGKKLCSVHAVSAIALGPFRVMTAGPIS